MIGSIGLAERTPSATARTTALAWLAAAAVPPDAILLTATERPSSVCPLLHAQYNAVPRAAHSTCINTEYAEQAVVLKHSCG